MTTARARHAGPNLSRGALYAAFILLALVPVIAFGIGPLTGESFDVEGPGGPFLAFSAGLLSFVSPCVLPLVPVYLTHLSGASVENGHIVANRRRTFTHALAFTGGFSLVFILLGAGAGLLGSYFFTDNQRQFQQIAGVLLVLMGLVLIPTYGSRSPLRSLLILVALVLVFLFLRDVARLEGDTAKQLTLGGLLIAAWLRFSGYLELPFLQRTFQVDAGRSMGIGYGKSTLVGGSFAFGWTPCLGPVLGSILTLAGTSSSAITGLYLLVAYSAGLSLPFLLAALAIGDVAPKLRAVQKYAPYIEVATAVMLIGLGVLLWTERLTGLNEFFDFGRFNEGL